MITNVAISRKISEKFRNTFVTQIFHIITPSNEINHLVINCIYMIGLLCTIY